MGTTCGSFSRPAVLASRNSRLRKCGLAEYEDGNNFTDTVRFLFVSNASYTSPKPPGPNSRFSRYGPNCDGVGHSAVVPPSGGSCTKKNRPRALGSAAT